MCAHSQTYEARELVPLLKKCNPERRFAINEKQNAIAVWEDAPRNCWVPLIAKLITGGWMTIATDLSVNGVSVWKNEVWTEA